MNLDTHKGKFSKEQALLTFNAQYYTLLLIHSGVLTGREKDIKEIDTYIINASIHTPEEVLARSIYIFIKAIQQNGWIDKNGMPIFARAKYFARAMNMNIDRNSDLDSDDLPF